MNDAAQTITALGTLVAAIGAVLIGYRNAHKAETAATAAAVAKEAALASKREVVLVGDKVLEVGRQLDGRLSELLAEARAKSRAEGYTAGEQAQRDRAAPTDVP
jgi:hypothetical protein